MGKLDKFSFTTYLEAVLIIDDVRDATVHLVECSPRSHVARHKGSGHDAVVEHIVRAQAKSKVLVVESWAIQVADQLTNYVWNHRHLQPK